jgi:hypothetical protein
MQIFSNNQRLRPNLDLEEVLQRRVPPLPGTPDRAVQDRVARAFKPSMPAPERLPPQARGAPPAATPRAPGSLEAKRPKKLAVTESSGEASLGSIQRTNDDEDSEEDAQ